MSDSDATFVGNVTRDPEMRYTPSGAGVVKFGIAVNRRWKDKNGDWQDEEPSFFNCQAWNQLAENIAATFVKGMRVIVKGRLRQRSWENDQGKKQYEVFLDLDACGPELKFATAAVEKVERNADRQTAPAAAGPESSAWGAEEPF